MAKTKPIYVSGEQVIPKTVAHMSAARELFESPLPQERGVLLPIQEKVFAAIKAAVEEANGDAGKLADLKYQIAEGYFFDQAELRQQIEDRYAAAERAWRKGRDAASQLLAIERAKIRFAKMTRDELMEQMGAYCQNPASVDDPDVVDVMGTAAMRAGIDTKEFGFDKAKEASDYNRPWRRDEKLNSLEKILGAGFGECTIVGPFGLETVPLEDLYDRSPIAGEQEQE